MRRDSDRQQVYAAEDLAGDSTVLVLSQPLPYLQETTDRLVASPWWIGNFGSDPVVVVTNRSTRRSFYSPDPRCISLSPQSVDLGTLCHELAHVAGFDRGFSGAIHGAGFRSLHVMVRAAVLGVVCAEDLRQVYHQFGLSVPALRDLSDTPGAPVLDRSVYERTLVVGRPATGSQSQPQHGPIAL